jgi:hypothetical protein
MSVTCVTRGGEYQFERIVVENDQVEVRILEKGEFISGIAV